MAQIPQDVQEFMVGKTAWIATASAAGEPNVTPKGSLRVLDDEHLVYAEIVSKKTRANLQENPRVAVTVVDDQGRGFQLKGAAELISGGPLFEAVAEQIRQLPRKLPPVQYVVRIAVDAVFAQAGGDDPGKRIV